MSSDPLDFAGVKQFIRGALYDGKFKVHTNGVSFKNDSTGKVDQILPKDIIAAKWMRVAYMYELQLITKSRSVLKYDGFREADYEPLKAYFSKAFEINLKKQDLSVKGWNRGDVMFENGQLAFLLDEKPSFEIPLRNVTKCDTAGKNEVAIEFHQNDDADIELVEMRFWIPNSAEGETDLVTDFNDKVMESADILSATGLALMSFEEVNCGVPKGRHEIKFFPTCFQMRGKTNVYIVQYTSILRLFLLPHNDGNQIFFVMSLDPPIKQGATRYHFVICQFHKDEEVEQELKLTDEEIRDKYENKLEKVMAGLTYEIFSRGMKAFSNRKITVPGSFKGDTDKPSIFVGYKNNTGYLYPLERGFLYVPRPPLHIRFDEVAHVNFARGTGTLRSFDFEITTKNEQAFTFTQIERGEYNKLFDFVKQKNIPIKNIGEEEGRDSDSDLLGSDESDDNAGGGGRGKKSGHDPYLEQMKKEGRERQAAGGSGGESEDSDFAPGEEDDVAEEYDSHAEYVSSSEEGAGGEEEGGEKKKERRVASTVAEPGYSKQKKKSKESRDSTEPARKRKKKEKDPRLPKRPASAFMLYSNELRPQIREKNPDLKITEVAKVIGQKWNDMPEEDKKRYTEKAEKLKEEYNEAVAKLPKEVTAKSKGKSSSSKKPAASTSQSTHVPRTSGAGVKSKEFISSDESSSGGSDSEEKAKKKGKKESTAREEKESEEEEEEDEGEDDEEEETKEANTTRSSRSTRGKGGEPLAEGLPEDGEDEEEAELSGGDKDDDEEDDESD